MGRRAIGLEIDESLVKLVELIKTKKGIFLNKAICASIPSSTNEQERRQLTIHTIKKIFAENRLRTKSVVLSVSGQAVFIRSVKISFPAEVNIHKSFRKIDRIMGFEAKQQIPFSLDEVVWDYQLFPAYKLKTHDVLLVAMKKSLFEEKLRQIQEANLSSAILDVAPLACYNSLRFNAEITKGKFTTLIDIGLKGTNLIIFNDDELWLRSLPVGIERFSPRDASSRSFLESLADEIKNSIEYYHFQKREEGGFTGSLIEGVVLSGDGAEIEELDSLLKERLKVDVRRLDPFKSLILNKITEATISKRAIFATSVGLGLRGLIKCAIEVNFFKKRLRQIKISYRRFLFGAILLLLLISLVSFFSFTGTGKYNLKKSELDRLNRIIESGSLYAPKIKTLLERKELLTQKIVLLYNIAQNRSLVGVDALTWINDILPSDVWITDLASNFSLEKKLGRLTLKLKSLSYQGVNNFLSGLKSTSYFKNIEPLSSSIKEGQTKDEEVVEFVVTMETVSP